MLREPQTISTLFTSFESPHFDVASDAYTVLREIQANGLHARETLEQGALQKRKQDFLALHRRVVVNVMPW